MWNALTDNGPLGLLARLGRVRVGASFTLLLELVHPVVAVFDLVRQLFLDRIVVGEQVLLDKLQLGCVSAVDVAVELLVLHIACLELLTMA